MIDFDFEAFEVSENKPNVLRELLCLASYPILRDNHFTTMQNRENLWKCFPFLGYLRESEKDKVITAVKTRKELNSIYLINIIVSAHETTRKYFLNNSEK